MQTGVSISSLNSPAIFAERLINLPSDFNLSTEGFKIDTEGNNIYVSGAAIYVGSLINDIRSGGIIITSVSTVSSTVVPIGFYIWFISITDLEGLYKERKRLTTDEDAKCKTSLSFLYCNCTLIPLDSCNPFNTINKSCVPTTTLISLL